MHSINDFVILYGSLRKLSEKSIFLSSCAKFDFVHAFACARFARVTNFARAELTYFMHSYRNVLFHHSRRQIKNVVKI